MKVLKKLFFVLSALLALFLIVGLFVDGNFNVSRTIEIEKPSDEVFEYVKHLKNQNNYGVWFNMDPDMEQSYSGEDGQVGFVSKWSSKADSVGSGEQEITLMEEGKRFETELRFTEPFEATNIAYITTEDKNGNTQVTWGIKGKINYPWNFFSLFMDMDQSIGRDLEGGLQNLKDILEKEGE